MKALLILVLGALLLNSLFSLVPVFLPDADPGVYIPYQCWFNVLLILNFILPSRVGTFLFNKKSTDVVPEKKENIVMYDNPMLQSKQSGGRKKKKKKRRKK